MAVFAGAFVDRYREKLAQADILRRNELLQASLLEKCITVIFSPFDVHCLQDQLGVALDFAAGIRPLFEASHRRMTSHAFALSYDDARDTELFYTLRRTRQEITAVNLFVANIIDENEIYQLRNG